MIRIFLFIIFVLLLNVDAQENLLDAVNNGDIEKVKALIAAKADVDVKNEFGYTALMWAARKGHKDIVKALIAAQADVNAKNKYGSTALMLAVNSGHKEIVEILKKAGGT